MILKRVSGFFRDIESCVAALYDGGWRSGDKLDLIIEYGLTEDQAMELCQGLETLEQLEELCRDE